MRQVEYNEESRSGFLEHVAGTPGRCRPHGADEVRPSISKSGELTGPKLPQVRERRRIRDYDPANPVMTPRRARPCSPRMDEIWRTASKPGTRVATDDVITFRNPSRWTRTCTSKARLSVDLYVSMPALQDTAFHGQAHVRGHRDGHRAQTTELPSPTIGPRIRRRRAVQSLGEIRRVSIDMWGICWYGAPPGSRHYVFRCDIFIFPISRKYSVHTNHAGLWSETDGTQVASPGPFTWAAPRRPAIVLPVRG